MSITANSNKKWIMGHWWLLQRYLRKNHHRLDRDFITNLIINQFPDEGRKLVTDFNLLANKKKEIFLKWIYFEPQITAGIFADQRAGKDAIICKVFDDIIAYCKKFNYIIPRFVTLGNIKKPPFVAEDDMYFSFKNIPAGKEVFNKQGDLIGIKETWIYCSEIETVIPARETTSPEAKLYSQLEGTMAQNHQKLFGCAKLTSKVDINFLRGMNTVILKYISLAKLNIENVERGNVISALAQWHRPIDKQNKSETLLCFDDNIFNVNYDLPTWWSDSYSHQFKNVDIEKIKEYIEVQHSFGMKPVHIQIAVAQKFRKDLSVSQINNYINPSK